jgi:integrase
VSFDPELNPGNSRNRIATCKAVGNDCLARRKLIRAKSGFNNVGIIPHDLRRSAIRNMIRAGVHQTVAMSISGHKTASVFERYNITDVKDKQAAMSKIELHNAL